MRKSAALIGLFMLVGMMAGPAAVSAAVKGPCEQELELYCQDSTPGRGHMADCLKRNERMLSPECKEFMTKFSQALKDLQAACMEDAHQYCRDTKTSYRRVVACLKEHVNEISTGCREHLKKP
jgi:hypothetical protein